MFFDKVQVLPGNFPLPAYPDSIPPTPSLNNAKEQFGESSEIIFQKIMSWINIFIYMLPNILLAAILLVFFYFLAKSFSKSVRVLLNRFSSNSAFNRVIGFFFAFVLFFIGFSIALNILSLDRLVASLLAGAGLVGLAVGFAMQDVIVNFIAGIIIAFKRPFGIGDLIEVKTYLGNVQDINFRSITIENTSGQHVIIPNRIMIENPVINYSVTGIRRVDVEVGVAYDVDLEEVQHLTKTTIKKLKFVDNNKPVELFYDKFAESAITFTLRVWVKFGRSNEHFLRVRSELIKTIHKTYAEHGIEIPLPIRTIMLRSKENIKDIDNKIIEL